MVVRLPAQQSHQQHGCTPVQRIPPTLAHASYTDQCTREHIRVGLSLVVSAVALQCTHAWDERAGCHVRTCKMHAARG
jgi:hypothetical protein